MTQLVIKNARQHPVMFWVVSAILAVFAVAAFLTAVDVVKTNLMQPAADKVLDTVKAAPEAAANVVDPSKKAALDAEHDSILKEKAVAAGFNIQPHHLNYIKSKYSEDEIRGAKFQYNGSKDRWFLLLPPKGLSSTRYDLLEK